MYKSKVTSEIKVKLVSYTKDPELTAFLVWVHSRPFIWQDLNKMNINTVEDIRSAYQSRNESFITYLNDTLKKLLETDLPIIECINFTFSFDDLPVYIRDQLVRHRNSSVWSQTSRNNNDSAYFDGYIPDEINENEAAKSELESLYKNARDTFTKLIELGIPAEDARAVIPSGKLTALCWTMNLRELKKILRERGCFIAQGPWREIICQIKEELSHNGMELFAESIGMPPCKYTRCIYSGENEQRRCGKDILPICPLYCHQKGDEVYPSNQNKEYLIKNLNTLSRIWKPQVIEFLKSYVNKGDLTE